MSATQEFVPDPPIRCRDFKIGCIGAGFIMADVHLAGYKDAGFPVVAIASRTEANAAKVAQRWGIPKVWSKPEQLIEDPSVEILDLAFPPDQQPALIRHALKQKHIKAILAQKPLALDHATAKAVVEEAAAAGKVLSINQNMRFLFGDPEDIYTAVRPDPRTQFKHTDGICASTIRFRNGVIATSLEDVWAGPREEGFEGDIYIKWRVEGTEGLAQGTIGWPDYPAGSPSTLKYSSKQTGGKWINPTWKTMWFPHAFKGVMEQLQYALKTGTTPELNGADNVKTMALVEAAYRSAKERRAVPLAEFGA